MRKFKSLRELFRARKRWIKNEFAMRADGESCGEHSRLAVCWCLSGGLTYVYGSETLARAEAEHKLIECIGSTFGSVVQFNDSNSTTHKEVLELVKRAKV